VNLQKVSPGDLPLVGLGATASASPLARACVKQGKGPGQEARRRPLELIYLIEDSHGLIGRISPGAVGFSIKPTIINLDGPDEAVLASIVVVDDQVGLDLRQAFESA
jgi:hypothetical protein